jgi:hypothetical protein
MAAAALAASVRTMKPAMLSRSPMRASLARVQQECEAVLRRNVRWIFDLARAPGTDRFPLGLKPGQSARLPQARAQPVWRRRRAPPIGVANDNDADKQGEICAARDD